MRWLFWALVLLVLGSTHCSELGEQSSVRTVGCGAPGLEAEPCATAGEACPCSGFECPTYRDGFCTAVCSEDLVWTLESCGRARPHGAAGAAGEAGASGAGGVMP